MDDVFEALPESLEDARSVSTHLADVAEKAKDYARASRADNTRRAYDSDWAAFTSWLRRQGFAQLPPDPQTVGLYLAACMSPDHQTDGGGATVGGAAVNGGKPISVATLERRLSGISWHYRQLGQPLDLSDRHISTVMAGIRRRHARPPFQKEAVFADDLIAMLNVLDNDLRGLRDKAILALGFAGGLRRSEIVGLDCGPSQTEDGTGWIEVVPTSAGKEAGIAGKAGVGSSTPHAISGSTSKEAGATVGGAGKENGVILFINGKTGWREVEIGRGTRPETCPFTILEAWMRLGRIGHGPLFRRIAKKNGGVGAERLNDKHVERLVKRTALAAGVRGDLSEGERQRAFAGHSLRAGIASSAQVDEAYVQKHLGHASAEMTRRYQRKRDRFRVNLTKAAGL